MNDVTVKYRLSLSEFMAACNEHWAAKKQGSRTNLVIGAVGVVAGAAMWSFGIWARLLLGVGALVILMIVGRSLLWRRAYQRAKKFTSDIVIHFSNERIHVETADGTSDLNWTFYTGFLDTQDYVLLYITGGQFSVIPKAAFKNKDEMQQVLALVKSKLQAVS